MNGLRNIVGTGTFAGLNPATEGTWKSTVNSTSGALSISLLLTAQQKIAQKKGGKPSFILTGLKQQRKFYEALQQQVRYVNDAAIGAGNVEAPKWNNLDIVADPDCPDEDLYIGKWESLFMVKAGEPYWQGKHDKSSGPIVWLQGTDAYGGKLTCRANLATRARNELYRFSALT